MILDDEALVERVARAIEQAARTSVPCPSVEISPSHWEIDGDEVPETLEHFVNETYIGEEGADRVFRNAALAAATAAIEAVRVHMWDDGR